MATVLLLSILFTALFVPTPGWTEDFPCGDANGLTRYIESVDPSRVTDPTCSPVPEANVPAQKALVASFPQKNHLGHFKYLKVVGGLAVEKTQAEKDAADAAHAAALAAEEAAKVVNDGATIGRMNVKRTTANQASTSTTLADVTGLLFPMKANTHYYFRCLGGYTSAASTTGLTISVNGPASPAWVSYAAQIAMTGTTTAYGIGAAYDAPQTAPTGGGATMLPFSIEGTLSTNASGGNFALRFASEVGGSTVTILRGSICTFSAAE